MYIRRGLPGVDCSLLDLLIILPSSLLVPLSPCPALPYPCLMNSLNCAWQVNGGPSPLDTPPFVGYDYRFLTAGKVVSDNNEFYMSLTWKTTDGTNIVTSEFLVNFCKPVIEVGPAPETHLSGRTRLAWSAMTGSPLQQGMALRRQLFALTCTLVRHGPAVCLASWHHRVFASWHAIRYGFARCCLCHSLCTMGVAYIPSEAIWT